MKFEGVIYPPYKVSFAPPKNTDEATELLGLWHLSSFYNNYT